MWPERILAQLRSIPCPVYLPEGIECAFAWNHKRVQFKCHCFGKARHEKDLLEFEHFGDLVAIKSIFSCLAGGGSDPQAGRSRLNCRYIQSALPIYMTLYITNIRGWIFETENISDLPLVGVDSTQKVLSQVSFYSLSVKWRKSKLGWTENECKSTKKTSTKNIRIFCWCCLSVACGNPPAYPCLARTAWEN